MGAINKNGQPRKAGSGRKKGSSSLVSVKLSDLVASFRPEDLIVVGRVFVSQKPDLAAKYVQKIESPTPTDGIQVTVWSDGTCRPQDVLG